MPKLTLLLGRTVMQVFDLDKTAIVVGRDEGADILIDNPSVSRRHAQIRQEGGGWVVEDLGSSNGTFLRGEKIGAPHPLQAGDEVGMGKFSLVFDKVVGDAAPVAGGAKPRAPIAEGEGTMHIKSHEVKELLKDSERKRRAHLTWESGGQRGTHYLSDAPAVLLGTDDLCDVRVPKGPKHHLLIINRDKGCEARYLAFFGSMTVKGRATRKVALKDGDVVEAKGLRLTFVADIN
jgi:predicted component of type VI protein secretion system